MTCLRYPALKALLTALCDKFNHRRVTVAVAVAYAPFILAMQYSKHKWLITRPESLWQYLPILHSEMALYGLFALLLSAATRSALAGWLFLTLYYIVSFCDAIAWSVMARPFHPHDVTRSLELITYYREFITVDNLGLKRVAYALVPLVTGSSLLFLRIKGVSLELKDHTRLAAQLCSGAVLAAACYLLAMPLLISPTYLHYNTMIRMGKQIYFDWRFSSLRPSDAEKRRLFGLPPPTRTTAGKRMNVILFVLETAPADLYPDLSPALQPWAERNGCAARSMPEHYTTYPESDRSNLSIMSGNYPCLNRGTDWVHTFDFGAPLPEVLANHGYRTHLLSVAPLNFHDNNIMMKKLGFRSLIESRISLDAHAFAKKNNKALDRTILYSADEELLEQGVEIIKNSRRTPYLLAFLPQSSHAPFQIPPGYHGSATQRELLVANADWQLRLVLRMLKAVEESGESQNTILIIVGDHGLRHPAESLLFQDQTRLSAMTFKVSFAYILPKEFPPLKQRMTSHIDIAPTVLDLLGIKYSREAYHGRSMLGKTTRSLFFLGGEYLPVSGFTAGGGYFMENPNRNLVLKNRRFCFDESATDTEEVTDSRERNSISRDLYLMHGLLTH
jgi:hypothetical protein